MMMQRHRWLHVVHSIAQREKVQPPRVSTRLTSFTQGSLLSSATPGYQEYNPDGVDVSSSIDHHATTRGLRTTWHLSPYHNMEYDHTIPMGLPHHQPFITAPQRGVCRCQNVGLRAAWLFIAKPRHRDGEQHGHLSSHHNAGYNHTIMWDCVPHGHSLPRHSIEIVRIMAIYHHATA